LARDARSSAAMRIRVILVVTLLLVAVIALVKTLNPPWP
jgi:hypothetical protein